LNPGGRFCGYSYQVSEGIGGKDVYEALLDFEWCVPLWLCLCFLVRACVRA
jgi:hypothetical protein